MADEMASGALEAAVERSAAHHGRWHVGLVVGAVTSDGARAVVPVGRLRWPDGPPPRADSLFEIGSITKVFTVPGTEAGSVRRVTGGLPRCPVPERCAPPRTTC